MTRGRRDRTTERDAGLTRRCIATGETEGKDGLIRFVLSPDGVLTPDLAERLPGRGVWVKADPDALDRACSKGLFSRGFKTKVAAPEGIVQQVTELCLRRVVDSIGLARKAGLAVCGFERTKEALWTGGVVLLFSASDGAKGGKSKLRGLSEGAQISSALDSHELGLAFGRETVIHAALLSGGVARRALRETRRLEALKGLQDLGPGADGLQDGGDSDVVLNE